MGAYAATGSFSRSAINSKAGSRTPAAGIISAIVVLLAIYTLTPVFFWVPRACLAAVIIHAIFDMITPPSDLYEFWRISPLDVIVFFAGLVVTIFTSIENGIFATIALSLLLLLVRMFKSKGRFLGSVKVRSVEAIRLVKGISEPLRSEESSLLSRGSLREVFIPLDRIDGVNPNVRIRKPAAGFFIYRFSNGLNYQNSNYYMEQLIQAIREETRMTNPPVHEKAGDRPWNDPAPRNANVEDGPDNRPTLKAIIFDFSTVQNVDLTAVQALIDTRNQLDRHAAPNSVQWHFANINSRWTKRALAAGGFGFPSFETEDGSPQHWRPIYSVAESLGGEPNFMYDADEDPEKADMKRHSMVVERVEGGGESAEAEDKITVTQVDVDRKGRLTEGEMSKIVALHGVNRPYFHIDIQSAVKVALAHEELLQQLDELNEDSANPLNTQGASAGQASGSATSS
jgi:sodium-independent sulfate anion transporter 11